MKTKTLAWPLLAVLATLLLHGVVTARHFSTPEFLKYPLAARQYNQGVMDRERLADFSPLYFHLHATAQKWLPQPERALLWLQVLLAALSAGLLLHLLQRYFPPLPALLATAAFVLDRSILVYEHTLEPEILLLFLLLGALCCLDGARWDRAFLGGILFSLTLLCRLNLLPLLFLVPWHFWLKRDRSRGWIRASAYFLLPSILALGCLALRNRSITGRLSLVVMNPGTVFFEGNNPNSLGQSSIYPPLVYDLAEEFPGQPDCQHSLYRLIARSDSGRDLGIGGVNRFWSGKAMNYIRDYPWRFLGALAAKANFFFHGFRRHDLATAYQDDWKLGRARIPTVPLALVSALALLGMLLARRQWRDHLLFHGILFTQLAVLLLTYVSARQRIAAYPAFLFFACLAVNEVARWRRRAGQALAAVAVVGLTLLLTVENDAMKEEQHQWRNFGLARSLYRQARRQRDAGSWRDASVSAMRALAAAPWLVDSLRPADLDFGPRGFQGGALAIHETITVPSFSSLFDRGTLALAAGELERARAIFSRLDGEGRRFKRDFDQSSQPAYYLARIALKKGDRPSALALLARARRDAPGDAEVLALSYAVTGQLEFSQRIERYFDGLDRDFFVGKALLETGEAARATPFLARVGRRLPFYRRGQVYLAAALAGSGQYEKGAEAYFAALGRRRDPVLLQEEILRGLGRWKNAMPSSARSHFFFGQALRQFGLYAAAMREQQAALALAPGHPLVEKEMRRLGEIIGRYPPR